MQEAIEKLGLALEGLAKTQDMVDDTDESWALDHIHLAINGVAKNVRDALELLKQQKEETCKKS